MQCPKSWNIYANWISNLDCIRKARETALLGNVRFSVHIARHRNEVSAHNKTSPNTPQLWSFPSCHKRDFLHTIYEIGICKQSANKQPTPNSAHGIDISTQSCNSARREGQVSRVRYRAKCAIYAGGCFLWHIQRVHLI